MRASPNSLIPKAIRNQKPGIFVDDHLEVEPASHVISGGTTHGSDEWPVGFETPQRATQGWKVASTHQETCATLHYRFSDSADVEGDCGDTRSTSLEDRRGQALGPRAEKKDICPGEMHTNVVD